MKPLNARYVADAASEASEIQDDHAIFGGRKLWEKFVKGLISKKKWQQIRNNTLYSRGDKDHSGNPNIRVVGNELWINDSSKRGAWIKGKLWLNKPVDLTCYDARIQLKDGEFKITISWEERNPTPILTDKSKGVVSVDTNPDGLAVDELNSTGNLQAHVYLKNNRIQFARHNKREYDVRQLAIEAVEIAKQAGKPIVVEKFDFKNKNNKKHSRNFNRMSHNFLRKQLNKAIISRAYKEGVEVIEVPAAYTSIVGALKYKQMYSLSVHNAAALVIGRLGLGLKPDKVVVDVSKVKGASKLEAGGVSICLKKKSLPWFKLKFRVYQKLPPLTGACLAPC